MSSPGTALVTGASSGIGAIYADRLARRGYDLILVARDTPRMERLRSRIKQEMARDVTVIPADLTEIEQVGRIADRIANDERITLLVNNAGMALNGTIVDEDPVNIARMIALNITAPTLLAAAAARTFPDRCAAGIINISSVMALMPEGYDGAYSGSKAYLLTLSQSLARQLDSRVTVQAVMPGATRTEIWERSGKDIDAFPPEIVMSAEDLVDAALAGFDRGESVTIPGLHDAQQWEALTHARRALIPNLNRREVAKRYMT